MNEDLTIESVGNPERMPGGADAERMRVALRSAGEPFELEVRVTGTALAMLDEDPRAFVTRKLYSLSEERLVNPLTLDSRHVDQ